MITFQVIRERGDRHRSHTYYDYHREGKRIFVGIIFTCEKCGWSNDTESSALGQAVKHAMECGDGGTKAGSR